MKLKNSIPPSRQGKKQVITYVNSEIGTAVLSKADNEGKTLQELVAEAMNKVCELHNREPIFKTGHSRIVKRKAGRAQLRTLNNAPSCRNNKRPIGGWFEEHQVKEAVLFSEEISLPIQKILEIGLKQITGMTDYTGKL